MFLNKVKEEVLDFWNELSPGMRTALTVGFMAGLTIKSAPLRHTVAILGGVAGAIEDHMIEASKVNAADAAAKATNQTAVH